MALRRRGLLGPDNQPRPAALSRTRASCPGFAPPDGIRLAPKFSQASLRLPPAASSAG